MSFQWNAKGVSTIHKVFDWANSLRKKLLFFIDKANVILKKQSSKNTQEDLGAILNAFLDRTKEQSNQFTLVLVLNTPEQFDLAVNNRLNQMVDFSLPGLEERERLIRWYFDKFVLQPATEGARCWKVEQFDYGALCTRMAEMTEGMSGREIAKLGVSEAQAAASEDGVLTEKLVLECVKDTVMQHRQKVEWQSEQERRESKSIYQSEKEESYKPIAITIKEIDEEIKKAAKTKPNESELKTKKTEFESEKESKHQEEKKSNNDTKR